MFVKVKIVEGEGGSSVVCILLKRSNSDMMVYVLCVVFLIRVWLKESF